MDCFQGKNPRYDNDILSFQIENLFRTKKISIVLDKFY
jgi:hypothetical protein